MGGYYKEYHSSLYYLQQIRLKNTNNCCDTNLAGSGSGSASGSLLKLAGLRVANSHAYGVILTHLTCYSRTHAIDKFTHAFKRNHTHTP